MLVFDCVSDWKWQCIAEREISFPLPTPWLLPSGHMPLPSTLSPASLFSASASRSALAEPPFLPSHCHVLPSRPSPRVFPRWSLVWDLAVLHIIFPAAAHWLGGQEVDEAAVWVVLVSEEVSVSEVLVSECVIVLCE